MFQATLRRLTRAEFYRWIDGLDAAVALPALDLALPLAELYAGLEFRRRPYLVDPN